MYVQTGFLHYVYFGQFDLSWVSSEIKYCSGILTIDDIIFVDSSFEQYVSPWLCLRMQQQKDRIEK